MEAARLWSFRVFALLAHRAALLPLPSPRPFCALSGSPSPGVLSGKGGVEPGMASSPTTVPFCA